MFPFQEHVFNVNAGGCMAAINHCVSFTCGYTGVSIEQLYLALLCGYLPCFKRKEQTLNLTCCFSNHTCKRHRHGN